MNPSDDVLEPDVQNALAQLKTFPPRDPRATARGRAQFLAQAQHLQAVSARSFWRQIEWITPFSQKERFSMPVLVAVVLAIAVAMGGSGVAVYAAQDALPTDPLYAVKLLTEDVQLNLVGDSTARVNTLLDLTQRRAQEIVALGAQGKPIPEQVTNRLEAQTEAALQIAAGMDEATMTRVLEQMRHRFTEQAQVIAQARAPEQAAPALHRVQEMLTARLQVVETALTDPHTLRERAQHRFTPSPRPTDLSPRPTITRTLTIPPRPTELPHPTITRTVTIPPRPTELPRPTITRTLTISPRPTELPRPPITRTLTVPPRPPITQTLPIPPRPTELPRSITPNPGPWNPTPPANATPVAPPWGPGPHKP